MINAETSYKNTVTSKLQNIEKSINETSKEGKFKIEVDGLNLEIEETLKKDGYFVSFDNKNRKYTISWNK